MLRVLTFLFLFIFRLMHHGPSGPSGSNNGNGSNNPNTPGHTPGSTGGTISGTQAAAAHQLQQGRPGQAAHDASNRYVDRNATRPGARNRMSGPSMDHQQRGELTQNTNPNSPNFGQWRGTGYHHRPGGIDYPDRRIGTPVMIDPNTGVYAAPVEFRNPNYNPNDPSSGPEWIPKSGNHGQSSFFPDNWSARDVDTATSDAFKNGTKDPTNGTFNGTYKGIKISGAYDPRTGHIKHAWPTQ